MVGAWVLQESQSIRTVKPHRDAGLREKGGDCPVCPEVLRENGRRGFPSGSPDEKSSG
jgi:hypothetical protein